MVKVILFFLTLSFGAQAQQGSAMIEDVIRNYYQGYQKADGELIQKAFHPDTRLLSVDGGKLDRTEMKDWLQGLKDRQARGDVRSGVLKVLAVDETDYAASVKLRITFQAFEFTDYLSLLKIDGKWIIVGKIYHFKEL